MEKINVPIVFRTILFSMLIIATGFILIKVDDKNENTLATSWETEGEYSPLDSIPVPIPTGELVATEEIPLPDLYLPGKGFTCTGLAYDEENNTYLIGEIEAILPGEQIRSSIIRVSDDFSEVEEKIPLYSVFPKMEDVQGVTIDTTNDSIWICSPEENKVWNISDIGMSINCITVNAPTGIAYDQNDDSLWVLSYNNEIYHLSKSGIIIDTFDFAYREVLDQCFLDKYRGLLYITAGENYTGRNNVYCFNVVTHEQYIACTVDSCSVEGIWLGNQDKMIILNDGYYHRANVDKNQANIYKVN